MSFYVILGILIPFLGTSFGAAFVLFSKESLSDKTERMLMGFAGGVMTAASVWSLINPAIEQSADMGRLAFLPAVAGFWLGSLFLLAMDYVVPHFHQKSQQNEGIRVKISKSLLIAFAVTLHNLPEGMAVGVVYADAGSLAAGSVAGLSLAIGIAIQNIPEGAIVSMPIHAMGKSRFVSFLYGVLSGVVEPLGALLLLIFSGLLLPYMPYLLSFAAGAMIYVVVEDLIPEMSQGSHSNWGVLTFALGFSLMMSLDVGLA